MPGTRSCRAGASRCATIAPRPWRGSPRASRSWPASSGWPAPRRCATGRGRRRGEPAELAAELLERRASDLERGFTQHGPHRDELLLLRDGRELKSFGSQGEQRLALLALLLAERAVLTEERGAPPLMLLDDVMSELDADRRGMLIARLDDGGQAVVTTTDLGHVPGARGAGGRAPEGLARDGRCRMPRRAEAA